MRSKVVPLSPERRHDRDELDRRPARRSPAAAACWAACRVAIQDENSRSQRRCSSVSRTSRPRDSAIVLSAAGTSLPAATSTPPTPRPRTAASASPLHPAVRAAVRPSVATEDRCAICCLWKTRSTTPNTAETRDTFRVTHPYHPLFGREYRLITSCHGWGSHRVYFHDDAGRLRKIPAAWTDVVAADPFVVVAAGRSAFRPADLLALADVIDVLRPRRRRRAPRGAANV